MKITQKIGFVFLQLFSGLFKLIGLRATRLVARSIGSFCYHLITIRKKVVLDNLASAFPQKSRKELETIARLTYRSILVTFFELLLFPAITRDKMKSMFSIDNLEEMKELLSENKGLIFWSGHLGSWEVGGAAASIHFGKPLFNLAKKQSNSAMNELLKKAREAHGNKMIWLGASVRHLIEVLRDGGIVGIVGDQRGPADSPRVLFFGKPTPFYTGTAAIISRTHCNAILAAAVREKDGNYRGILEKLNLDNLPENMDERIKEINQRYAHFLEKVITQYPDQYFWVHKIWKY